MSDFAFGTFQPNASYGGLGSGLPSGFDLSWLTASLKNLSSAPAPAPTPAPAPAPTTPTPAPTASTTPPTVSIPTPVVVPPQDTFSTAPIPPSNPDAYTPNPTTPNPTTPDPTTTPPDDSSSSSSAKYVPFYAIGVVALVIILFLVLETRKK